MADSGRNPLQYLPLTVGMIGGTMLMVNRLLTPALSDSQARSDVVGVILSAVLILTTLLWETDPAQGSRSGDSRRRRAV